MALFSRVKTWVSNEVLTASDLNAEFNNILTNATASSMVSYSANASQMQTTADPGSAGSESLAASIAEEITRLRFVIKRLFGGTYWYTAPASTLATGGINTAALADACVTRVKLAASSPAVSTSSGTFSTNATGSFTAVTNLSQSYTSSGRPITLMVVSANDSGNDTFIGATNAGAATATFAFFRDSTRISRTELSTTATVDTISAPAFIHFDTPAAGTYTYSFQAKASTGTMNVYCQQAKLVVIES